VFSKHVKPKKQHEVSRMAEVWKEVWLTLHVSLVLCVCVCVCVCTYAHVGRQAHMSRVWSLFCESIKGTQIYLLSSDFLLTELRAVDGKNWSQGCNRK
jgi:hypothetical protein